MSLEESNCANLVGDLGNYQTAIVEGLREAQAHNYVCLFLRGLGFQPLSASSLGDANEDFSLASRGLSLFWSGHVDVMKGYNLYYDLDAAADGLRLTKLQVVLWRVNSSLHSLRSSCPFLRNLPSMSELRKRAFRRIVVILAIAGSDRFRRSDGWSCRAHTGRTVRLVLSLQADSQPAPWPSDGSRGLRRVLVARF